MKKMVNIAALSLGVLMAQATVIVDMSGNFNTGTARPTTTVPTLTTVGEVRTYNNGLTTPIWVNGAPVTGGNYVGPTLYGIFRHRVVGGVTNSTLNVSPSTLRIEAADSIAMAVGRNEGASTFDYLYVIKKADFANGLNATAVGFDTNSSFTTTISWTANAKAARAVVQNGSTWYISQDVYNNPVTAGTRVITSNAYATAWAVWDPLTSINSDLLDFSSTVPGSTFKDIQAVGFYTHLTNNAAMVTMATTTTGFNVSAVAVPEPATIGMLGLGALVALLVRRMAV